MSKSKIRKRGNRGDAPKKILLAVVRKQARFGGNNKKLGLKPNKKDKNHCFICGKVIKDGTGRYTDNGMLLCRECGKPIFTPLERHAKSLPSGV